MHFLARHLFPLNIIGFVIFAPFDFAPFDFCTLCALSKTLKYGFKLLHILHMSWLFDFLALYMLQCFYLFIFLPYLVDWMQ